MVANGYANFIVNSLKANIDFDVMPLKAMLTTPSYTANLDTHQYRSQVTNEVTGTGYTTGGVALTGVALSQDTLLKRLKIVANTADFGVLTVPNIGQVVVYIDTGSSATDVLVSRHSFAARSPVAGTFTYVWSATDGIGYFTY